jgi:cardiolipin synthase
LWAIVLLAVLMVLARSLAMLTIIFLEKRNPEKTTAWLAILTVLPVLGFITYWVMGRSARRRNLYRHKFLNGDKVKKIEEKQRRMLAMNSSRTTDREIEPLRRMAQLLTDRSYSPLTANNVVQVLSNGEDKFRALFKALEEAQEHIHLEYYIFKDDEVGRCVRDILIRKSREGIEVRVIVDGLGSRTLSQPFLKQMKQAGVQTAVFFPVRFPFLSNKTNFRNHRKIVVVDGRIGFVGGMNIGDEYLSRNTELGYWRDTHLRLEGEAVHLLQTIFLNDWLLCTWEPIEDQKYFPELEPVGDRWIVILANGPDEERESIREVFFTVLTTAKKRIFLTTPYFVPDESIVMALKTAALSGVDVRLIVQGIPEYKTTYYASQSYFEDLLQAGVKIYKYEKGILHAKVILVDDRVGIVGSANCDMRSFQLDFEAGALVYSRDFVDRLEQDFLKDIANSSPVDPKLHSHRPFLERVKESGARLLSPLL